MLRKFLCIKLIIFITNIFTQKAKKKKTNKLNDNLIYITIDLFWSIL